MKIGTKSVLFGAHCFAFHWFFVALGWWKVYGFRRVPITSSIAAGMLHTNIEERWVARDYAALWRPALWVAFIVHDFGYVGKPNMDGEEGEQHPKFGAAIMRALFGEPWGSFVLYHSRFLAKQHGEKPSPLCMADKLAFPLTPRWLYLPFVRATGEIAEYMAKASSMNATGDKYCGLNLDVRTQEAWHADVCAYVLRWVEEHKDGRDDTWTPATKVACTANGAWS